MASTLLLIMLALLGLAWLALWSAARQRVDRKSMDRFNHALASGSRKERALAIESNKPKASLKEADWRLMLLLRTCVVVVMFVLIQSILGWMPAMLVCTAGWVVLYLCPRWKRARVERHMLTQLPLFIDQLIRSLSTGRSLESAFRLVTMDTNYPLREVLDRITKATDHGDAFGHAFEHEMRQLRIKEFQAISLGIRISNTYGSSPKEMLQSVVNMVRNQEQARNELAAMTGETKMSAVILTLTPAAIVLYMFVMNPGYLEMMLADATGAIIFKTAIALQVIGAWLFWKMLKSV